jgi:hypothetical protein
MGGGAQATVIVALCGAPGRGHAGVAMDDRVNGRGTFVAKNKPVFMQGTMQVFPTTESYMCDKHRGQLLSLCTALCMPYRKYGGIHRALHNLNGCPWYWTGA